jgi:hypothetical protein
MQHSTYLIKQLGETMPIKINGTNYPLPSDDGQRSITLHEQLMIEKEFKKPMEKLFRFTSISDRTMKSMSEEKQDEVEIERRLALFVMVWIARLRAGEKLTFDEATDFELNALDMSDDSGDADPLVSEEAKPTKE